jgi:hypothetical protein
MWFLEVAFLGSSTGGVMSLRQRMAAGSQHKGFDDLRSADMAYARFKSGVAPDCAPRGGA